mmetsp:Transcript_47086/g.73675  ORF Transcript_47086/g.73675 Transcript_47086/m.73675 type:complete len:197 (-) Transcript_47086:1577-2167(-)|eukprot:CAMPEP_0184302234 /NCGR_PEP_ID=MMETSP1049-20130417/12268_1 /TAXON_ID=77928 /ORGANISM="Proteomonas sulcata, Strain CCMP704" /LENGTH=196 /DNA_ID=CAMNT_0026613477 /DNA_START=142 /DNA_END=732 /DNA_ORIENTATION=-
MIQRLALLLLLALAVAIAVSVSLGRLDNATEAKPAELFSFFPDPVATEHARRMQVKLRQADEGQHRSMGKLFNRISRGGQARLRADASKYEAPPEEPFLKQYLKNGGVVHQGKGTKDLVNWAIHDMQKQQDKKISRALRKDMRAAAKEYADDITKEENIQTSYEQQRRRERQLARQKALARDKNLQQKNTGWLNLF